jgi:hypothetical protein
VNIRVVREAGSHGSHGSRRTPGRQPAAGAP